MTVTSPRTKVEQALSGSFEAVAAQLPGGHAAAEARKAAIGTFAALGLPHRRIEEWKYTDLRVALKEALPPAVGGAGPVSARDIEAALETLGAVDAYRVVFVDGMHVPELSAAGAPGLQITPLSAALAKSDDGPIRGAAPGQEAVIALNTAFMTDGGIVRIDAEAKLAKPLLLVFARSASEGRLLTTRNVVTLEAGARATIIET